MSRLKPSFFLRPATASLLALSLLSACGGKERPQADLAASQVTDWYVNPENPGERMKINVSILDQDLRADALRVGASRQVSTNGTWVDAPVKAATTQKLEQIILTKARDLRRGAISN